jgi:hypothetical protein
MNPLDTTDIQAADVQTVIEAKEQRIAELVAERAEATRCGDDTRLRDVLVETLLLRHELSGLRRIPTRTALFTSFFLRRRLKDAPSGIIMPV